MGEVYLARDNTELEREVAVKVLPAEMAADPERMRRFVQEARTASSLNHPNILTIHEIGEADSSRFIASEYVEGETLRQRLSRSRPSLREALDIAAQVASALVAAHKAGVVHRDIKPENVMVRGDGIVKVLDFGIAKLAERRPQTADTEAPTKALVNTGPGTVMGTVSYMSPEQARGLAVDERTWKRMSAQGDDATIMGAFGGYEKGWKDVGPRYDWAAAQYKNRKAQVKTEYLSVVVSSDLAFTVAIERQAEARAGGQEPLRRELRATQAFRREGGSWKLLHRHADPLMEKRAPSAPTRE